MGTTGRSTTRTARVTTPRTKAADARTPGVGQHEATGAARPGVPGVGANLVVLCGPCPAPPEVRALESGSRLATFALRCPSGQAGQATSVPVTVWDPPAWLETVEAGDWLVVVGRMRRRFYQRPGGLGSRVDVEAELVGRARDRRRIDAALRRADAALDVLR
jgi:hypothetical protein